MDTRKLLLISLIAIADDSGIITNHISKASSELKVHKPIDCINLEVRKGKLYRLIDKCEEVIKNIDLV